MAAAVTPAERVPLAGSWSEADAAAWCRAYTKERAKNFYYAFAVLPREQREAIYAAYAFSGYVDDIVDELNDPAEQQRLLADARERLHRARAGAREGPLFTALGAAFDRFAIPVTYFERLVDGVEMDLTRSRYETWPELREYCFHVASMVGLICTAIFGARGRVYFPRQELARFQLTPEDILAGTYDERFVALMRHYHRRARLYYRRGRELLPLLDLRPRMCVNVLQGVYAAILTRIARRNYDVLTERVALAAPEKLALVGWLCLRAAFVRPR
ncbi:MAG: phytoene/squalene synthase family protein [Chloroflexota bacterium]|nr:phytoene/squalene synthase family protein [Dehalococcoidia bacterium]MDW8046694.1 phytoene/squalene synthase family protein [Chloroflexota bacterium]